VYELDHQVSDLELPARSAGVKNRYGGHLGGEFETASRFRAVNLDCLAAILGYDCHDLGNVWHDVVYESARPGAHEHAPGNPQDHTFFDQAGQSLVHGRARTQLEGPRVGKRLSPPDSQYTFTDCFSSGHALIY